MERRTPEDRAGELRRRLRDAGVPPETAAQLFAIAFPPERTPGELLTIGEVEDWHGRLHEATVPGDVVDAWNEAKGALFALVMALAGSVRADEVGGAEPHGGPPAGVIEPPAKTIERLRRQGCTCDDLDPRATQGGARCGACELADAAHRELRVAGAPDLALQELRDHVEGAEVRS